jgi:single-strand DNA-binding protein
MAGSLNRVSLIGNCGADPEIRVTQGGKKVASLRIATSESWTDKASGEKKEVTDWHSIVVWNEHLIPVIEKYVKKGSKVMIEGQLKTRKWQDKDGSDRYSTEVVLQGFNGQLILLGEKSGGGKGAPPAEGPEAYGQQSAPKANGSTKPQGAPAAPNKAKTFDDEIPF